MWHSLPIRLYSTSVLAVFSKHSTSHSANVCSVLEALARIWIHVLHYITLGIRAIQVARIDLFSQRPHCCCPLANNTHMHTGLMALFLGLPGWAGTRKVKPIWILLKKETVSGSGISWAVCKSAPLSRQITMPAPHYSVFYRPDALPAA